MVSNLTPIDSSTIEQSIKSEFRDFEDALQYYSAKQEGIDYLITRNKKDFSASEIPVFEPQEFIDYITDNSKVTQ